MWIHGSYITVRKRTGVAVFPPDAECILQRIACKICDAQEVPTVLASVVFEPEGQLLTHFIEDLWWGSDVHSYLYQQENDPDI